MPAAAQYGVSLTLAYKLSAAEYGTLGIFTAYATLAQAFIGLGASATVGRLAHAQGPFGDRHKDTLLAVFQVLWTGVILLVLAVLLFGYFQHQGKLSLLAICYGIVFLTAGCLRSLFVFTGELRGFFWLNLFAAFLSLAITWVLVSDSPKWDFRVIAMIAAEGVVAIYAWYWLMARIRAASSGARSAEATVLVSKCVALARESIPIIPHMIASSLYLFSDRLVIAQLLGTSEVAVFWFWYQVFAVFSMGADILVKVVASDLYSAMRSGSITIAPRILRPFAFSFFFVLLLIWFGVDLTLINKFAPEQMAVDRLTLGSLCVGAMAQGVYIILSQLLFSGAHYRFISVLTFTSAVFYIALGWVLVTLFGLPGMAVAFAISAISRVGLMTFFLQSARFSWKH